VFLVETQVVFGARELGSEHEVGVELRHVHTLADHVCGNRVGKLRSGFNKDRSAKSNIRHDRSGSDLFLEESRLKLALGVFLRRYDLVRWRDERF